MRPLDPPPVRRLFVPDTGYALFEIDLARADAQIVAAESGDIALLEAFRQNIDIYRENAAWMYEIPLSRVTAEQRQWHKAGVHACLTEDHEVLTREGWKSITEKPSEIMCWEKGVLQYCSIAAWYDEIINVDLLEWNERSFSQHVSIDHKMPYINSGNNREWSFCEAQDLRPTYRLPKSGKYLGGTSFVTPTMARLWCAIHADASKNDSQWRFHLKKQRKITRLHDLLRDLSIDFKFSEYKDGSTMTSFVKIDVPSKINKEVLWFKFETMKAYVDEAPFWDGSRVDRENSTTHARYFITGKKDQAEWFATMVHLTNRAALITEIVRGYKVSIGERPLFRQVPSRTSRARKRMLCPTTPTGFFMIRRNGVISVTGNCDYGAKARTLAHTLHCTVARAEQYVERWTRELHPGIGQWHRRIADQIRRTRTVHNVYGFRRYYTDRLDNILPQALAWIASSTVSVTINRAMLNVYNNLPEVQILLQIHDSILGQVRVESADRLLPAVLAQAHVEIPYDPPLTIPVTMKVSETSWGDIRSYKSMELTA